MGGLVKSMTWIVAVVLGFLVIYAWLMLRFGEALKDCRDRAPGAPHLLLQRDTEEATTGRDRRLSTTIN